MAVSVSPVAPIMVATGKQLVDLANARVGGQYVLGALAPKNNPDYIGPWDCAEFVSWVIFQTTGMLYGCSDNHGNPKTADAFTGFFHRDVKLLGIKVSVEEAAATPGALLLRVAVPKLIGHIVISNGLGGTVEAHSHNDGVINSHVSGRRWDIGILVPGVVYQSEPSVPVAPPVNRVFRVTHPLINSPKVGEIQRALLNKGFDPQGIDNKYGQDTARAVIAFQKHTGLLVDGEVGEQTASALGIEL